MMIHRALPVARTPGRNRRVFRSAWWALLVVPLFCGTPADASPPPAVECFQTIAETLLRAEFGFGVTNIPIFTNGSARANGQPLYSARVHQLLQIAANITEATTGSKTGETWPFYPMVYRPQFATAGSDVFIRGYTVEADATFSGEVLAGLQRWRDLDDAADRPAGGFFGTRDNFYGIPLIIGARKGLPNFNEFALQSVVQFARRLEFRKTQWTDAMPRETNQMFVISVTNQAGVEAWNSYSSAYPRSLTVFVANSLTATLTNDDGVVVSSVSATNNLVNYPAGTWAGGRFKVPLLHTQVMLPPSAYKRTPAPHFEPSGPTNGFEQGQGLYTNQWGLILSNRIVFVLFDSGHIVDAVALKGMEYYFDVSDELARSTLGGVDGGLWSIRPVQNGTEGVFNQIYISLNPGANPSPSYGVWLTGSSNDRQKAIQDFRVFLGIDFSPAGPPTNLVMEAPFLPIKTMSRTLSWQANDPLVHQTLEQLTEPNGPRVSTIRSPLMGQWLGNRNTRYSPWGGPDQSTPTGEDINPSLKDPGVWSSDYWDFPESQPLDLRWLGRIHRGTPWQSIYLKSAAAPMADWLRAVGGADTHPTNDWRLVSRLAPLFNTNPPPGLLSINNTNSAAWRAALDGVAVVSNSLDGCVSFVMNSNSPQAAIMAGAVGRVREQQANHYFKELGDILATPELSVASPWFDPLVAGSFESCLTDSDYEAVASHLLPQFRPDLIGSIRRQDDNLVLEFPVFPDYTYALEASNDLRQWTRLETRAAAGGALTFARPVESGESRFFRLVLLP